MATAAARVSEAELAAALAEGQGMDSGHAIIAALAVAAAASQDGPGMGPARGAVPGTGRRTGHAAIS